MAIWLWGFKVTGARTANWRPLFVRPILVLQLVKARWRTRSEIGNAEGEVPAVNNISRAASKRVNLLTVGVTVLFAPLRSAGHVRRHGDHHRGSRA
jgi:hypothetical protein